MALSLVRPKGRAAEFFDDWRTYLHERGEEPARDETAFDRTARPRRDATLCAALAENNVGFVTRAWWEAQQKEIDKARAELEGDPSPETRSEIEREIDGLITDREFARRLRGFPWITPVLGSGCLAASDGAEVRALAGAPRVLAAASRGWPALPDGRSCATVIRDFSASLVSAKLQVVSGGDDEPKSPPEHELDEVKARAVLCAALLTQLYFEVASLRPEPMAPASTPLQFARAGHDSRREFELSDELVVPLVAALGDLKKALAHRNVVVRFIAGFIDAVLKDLASPPFMVRAGDATLMSEVAWHLITEGTAQYPGWSDLVVLLSFAFDWKDRRHRWPHLTNLTEARNALSRSVRKTTETSWRERLERGSSAASTRDRLYDIVAELLIAQAALVAPKQSSGSAKAKPSSSRRTVESTPTKDDYPPAVAFTTSIDLELEMTLLAKRHTFLLLAPFYLQKPANTDGAVGYVWLQTVVEPPERNDALSAEDLQRITEPRAWSLVTSNTGAQSERPKVPVVVRLAGCPLISVPKVDDAPSLRAQIGNRVTLAGTVLLDEHTALHQWAADLSVLNVEDGNAKDRLGLPTGLVGAGNPANRPALDARFWMLLGVQLGDDAVRQRIAATIAATELRGVVGLLPQEGAHASRAGVVLNRRSTPTERDVLLWEGLDVVESGYEAAIADLEHMVEHARHPELRRIDRQDACQISDTQR